MFPRHRGTARAAHGPSLRPTAPDRAVLAAEAVLRRAWALELARLRDSAEFTVRIERGNCDAAVALLHRAQRGGDPARIGAARADLSQALDSARTATAARDRIRRTQREQLRLLARRPKRLTAAVRADLPARPGSAAAAAADRAAGNAAARPGPARRRSVLVDLRSRIRRRRKPLRPRRPLRPLRPLRLMRRRPKALESD
jgi:hypothetical protein